jgi:RNA polymerase sigma-70 factor (ECF subfamily)
MPPRPLHALLEQLARGDVDAAEQLFHTYEPYLRRVVRRHLPQQLRAKLDSQDVVQSVWVDVFRRFREAGRRFASAAHLRAFLVMVARHRLADRLRHYQGALDREELGPDADVAALAAPRQPRPSEVAQAEELWRKMLELCPPGHREVLRLKRQGLLLEEIAACTGLHEGSVRRILRKLARQLAVAGGPRPARPGPVP